MTVNEIGNRIRDIRLQNSLSMREFGNKIDKVQSGVVSNWENGKQKPNKKRIENIARFGNVSTSFLIYGDVPSFISSIIDEYFSNMKPFELLDIEEIKEENIFKYNKVSINMFYKIQQEYIDQYGEHDIDTWELKNEADNRIYRFINNDLKNSLNAFNKYELNQDDELQNRFRILNDKLKDNLQADNEVTQLVNETFISLIKNIDEFTEEQIHNSLIEPCEFFVALYNNKFKHYLYTRNLTTIDNLTIGLFGKFSSNDCYINLSKFDNWYALSNDSKDIVRNEIKKFAELLIMRELNK